MIPVLYSETEKDFGHNGICVLNYTEDYEVTEEANGVFELYLEYPASAQWASELKDQRQIKASPNDLDAPHVFRIYEIITTMETQTISVYATSRTNDLAGNLVNDVIVDKKTPQQALNLVKADLVEPTDYNFISDITTTSTTRWTMRNPLNCIVGEDNSLVKYWGGEVKRTNDTIYLYSRRGRDDVTVLRQGKNLEGFEMTVSTKGLTTRILPFFRYYDEETEEEHTIIGSVVNSPLMNNYPVQSILPVDYSDEERVIDLATLNSAAAGYFSYRNPDSDKPKVKIDIDLVQLADSSQYEQFRGLETVGLFDTVTVWVAKYNVDVKVKINKVVYNGMKKQVVKVTAGTPTSSLYDDVRNRYKQEVSDLKKYIDGVENGVRNAIRVAAGGKSTIFEGYTEPPIASAEPNDIWYQQVGDGEVVMHIFDGLAWMPRAYSAGAMGGTIDFGNVNAINFNANWITSGQLDLSRGLSIGSGTDSVLYIDQATGQVVMNVSKITINAIDAATKDDIENISLTPGPQGPQGEPGLQGPKGATGSQGPRGDTGTSVESVTEYYLATSASSGILSTNAGFTTAIQTMTPTNKYLWNYEKINFSDGTSQPTVPVIIGVYGDKGSDGGTGATGRSITGITEHYLATTLATGVTRGTSGWSTTMQKTTPTNKYLWNYETITWSSGTTTTYVEPIVIGIHGEQGPQGDTGPKGATGSQGPKGDAGTSVLSVTEYYLATASSTGVTTATSGWTTTIQTIDATKKYLWNYEKINFSDGTSPPTIPIIIGVYGDKGQPGSTGATGRSIVSIQENYLATSAATGVTRSTSGWTTTMQTTTSTNKYLWNYETITWSSGTITTYVEPIIIGIHGAQGPQGPQGIQGPNGANGTSQYIHIRYSTASTGNPMTTTPSASTLYIGIANTTSSTAPTGYASYTWSLYKGEKGDKGVPGSNGTNGTTTYTWVKYADTDAGAGMSDSPIGKKYIGLAFNKTTATETATASLYTWSLMPQNIVVGGRNLLLNTKGIPMTSSDNGNNNLSVVGSDGTVTITPTNNGNVYNNGGFKTGVDRVQGETYTLSFDINTTRTYAMYWRPSNDKTLSVPNTSGKWQKFTHTYKQAGATKLANTGFLVGFSGLVAGEPVKYRGFKLEKGDIATDWTEAPEDVQSQIDEKASNEALNEVASGIGEIQNDLIENYAGKGDIERLDEALIASNTAIEEARADSIKDIGVIDNRTAILEQNFGDYAVDWNFVRTSVRLADEGMRISKAGEKTGLLIQNDKISFVSDDNEVAYISGQELYITQGTFLDNVKIGQHRVSTLPSDSTITVIRYEG